MSVEETLGDAEAAARAARELAEVAGGGPGDSYNVAGALARSIPIAPAAERAKLANAAVEALRTAVAAGWNNATHTARNPDLIPLHGRDDYNRLLAEMFDRTFPANPFAPP